MLVEVCPPSTKDDDLVLVGNGALWLLVTCYAASLSGVFADPDLVSSVWTPLGRMDWRWVPLLCYVAALRWIYVILRALERPKGERANDWRDTVDK